MAIRAKAAAQQAAAPERHAALGASLIACKPRRFSRREEGGFNSVGMLLRAAVPAVSSMPEKRLAETVRQRRDMPCTLPEIERTGLRYLENAPDDATGGSGQGLMPIPRHAMP